MRLKRHLGSCSSGVLNQGGLKKLKGCRHFLNLTFNYNLVVARGAPRLFLNQGRMPYNKKGLEPLL